MLLCPNCQKANAEDAKFCSECATPLAAAIRELRKTVTVLFADVTGSTALGERLDPESLRGVMSHYFSEMQAAVERHEGTVEKFIGDAVMAVFGIPDVHEDDALRAVRAASEMRDRLGALNQELDRTWGVTLQIRTGVNTGEVVAGDASVRQSLVTGDAVNVAARLEQAAAPGEILLGQTTHRLVRDAVEVEAAEPLSLKGKSEPVPAYLLIRVLEGVPGVARREGSRLVGRQDELKALSRSFDRAVSERSCQLFTVLGPAGVGKSRLIGEFLSSLSGRATTLHGRCLPYGEGITFWPIVEIVQEAAGIGVTDAPAEALENVRGLLEDDEHAEKVAERIGALLGYSDSAGAAEDAFWAVRRLVEAVARAGPAVIVFDDIHWAEPTLLDLIEYVSDFARESPLLLLCVARPELLDTREGWGAWKPTATSVLLEPLSDEEARRLIENLLGRAQLSRETMDRISDAAEGNPLFVEEMISMLIDDGSLRRANGDWVAARDLSQVSVPPTIDALLAARLGSLSEDERGVVERASVEGRVFHRGAVTALGRAGAPLGSHLQILVRKQLIGAATAEFSGEDAFAFRHILIRDAAYRGLPKESRADLHERFAEWLVARVGDRVPQYEEILGYHLEQAAVSLRELGRSGDRTDDLGIQGAAHLGIAGRRALERGDVAGATNLLSRATTLLPADHPDRPLYLLYLGQAMLEGGRYAAALSALDEAAAAADACGDEGLGWRARMETLDARVQTVPGALAEAPPMIEQAIGALERLADHAGLAKVWFLLGVVRWTQMRAGETVEMTERSIRHARLAGDRRVEAENLGMLATAALWGPTPVHDALVVCDQVLERAQGHGKVEGWALLSRGRLLAMRGDFEEGRLLIARGRAVQEELGLLVTAAGTCQMSATLEMLAGDVPTAERQLLEGYGILKDLNETGLLSTVAGYAAEALLRGGKDEDAERYTVLAEELTDPADVGAAALWRSTRARLRSRRGDHDEAEGLAREAVELMSTTDFLEIQADSLVALAEVQRNRGRSTGALTSAIDALDLYQRKGHTVSIGSTNHLIEQLRAELSHGP